MKEQDQIWNLVARKLAGEATEEELNELEDLLARYPDMTYIAETLTNLWTENNATDKQETEAAFARHMSRMAKKLETDTPAKIYTTPYIWKSSRKRRSLLQRLPGRDGMWRNYLKTASRNVWRNKTFSLINVVGLAVGMAGAILLLLWIQNELSSDQFHAKKDRIYQVLRRSKTNDGTGVFWRSSQPVGPALKNTYPQVEEAVRTNWVAAFILKNGDRQIQSAGLLTDPGFLKLFDFPLISGNRETALNNPHSILITEQLAQKLFGKEEAINKVIKIDSNINFTVTGVLKDLPSNTGFNFEYLVPWSYMKDVKWDDDSWTHTAITTYVLLKPGVTEKQADVLFKNVIKANSADKSTEILLHPMRKWNLWSRFDENGEIAGGGIEVIRLLGIIAAFLLLIACINYMNLSTARSEKRAKEVGIRKVAGAGKASLVAQFIGESVIIAFIAGITGLLIAQSALGWFATFTGRQLSIPYASGLFWMAAISFVIFTGVLAGSYPAFYLSAFKPVKVLKGTFKAAHSFVTPRKVLVVLQFSFAIIFIFCTIIVYRQILFAQKRDTGIDMKNLAFAYVKGEMLKNYPYIKSELLSSGAATAVTRTNSPISDVWTVDDTYQWPGKDPGKKDYFIRYCIDNGFTGTMNIKLLAGRDINYELYPTDSSAVLLTETAVKRMNLQQPLGQLIKNDNGTWHVIGVIKDFIPGLPYEKIQPIVLHGQTNAYGVINFRLNDKNAISKDLDKVTQVFKKYNPDYPLEYHMVEESYASRFRDEKNVAQLASTFAGLTILICCLGLFALAAYMAESRVKEIGVRKVLGASVAAIVTLISSGFLKLIIIAFLIASPIAWYIMHTWLQHYDYRVDIAWWIFALTGGVSLLLAVCTVSFQALKAALASPIKALRSE
jgi:ABC-type antimicrobial peptide transport system permease subunit